MHKIPLTDLEREGLIAHGLESRIGNPSQLADVFRQGVAWALAKQPAQPQQASGTEWLVCPKCAHQSPYTAVKAKTLAEEAELITKQARAALAQIKPAQQEPVAEVVMAAKPPNASPAWLPFKIVHAPLEWLDSVPVGTKLYTPPPAQRKPVPPSAYESLMRDMTTIAAREVPKGIPVAEFAMHALADAELREHDAPAQRKPLTITEESAWDLARYVYARSNPHESPQILLSAMEIKRIIEAAYGIEKDDGFAAKAA